MERANNDDFQPSTDNSHFRPKTRNKLSSKHRVKRRCKNECDVEDLFSPVSHCFKRNASSFMANTVNAVCGEEDNVAKSNNSDLVKSCIPELSKQTETTGNECNGSSEETVNATMCFSSKSASETCKKLNYSLSNSLLASSSVTVIQVADAEGKADSAKEECLQEFRIVTKHGHGLTEASNDDASSKSQCMPSVKLNDIETVSALDSLNDIHISCEGGTRRYYKCPLCWKIFEKNHALVLHMKVCAARHNVTTRQLLDALELQDRQAAEREALGLPDIPTTYTAKKSSKKSGSDSNLQLALALSASLQEAEDREHLGQDECLLEAGLGHEVVEQQKLLWERFGFRSHSSILAPSNSRHKSACKSKTFSTALMRRTKEERETLITEKVAIILMGEDSKPVCTALNISHNIHLVDGLVDPTENLRKYQSESCLLWNMASVSCLGKELESYYVKELTKFISPNKVPVGSKLKHLSQIPGRNRTPERDSCSPVSKIPLAQLMAGSKEETKTVEHREPQGRQNFVASLTDESAYKDSLAGTLMGDWKSVLNKNVMSDLTIYVEKDLEIPAHKLVLYVRCRAILKDVVSEMSVKTNKKTSDMLLWVDVSYRAALAFLHFVYCGVASKILYLKEDDLLNVKRLAERYHVSELLHYLRVASAVRSRVNKRRNSSLNLMMPHDSMTDHRKRHSLRERKPNNQFASLEAVPSPRKQVYSNSTFNSYDTSAELSKRSVRSETNSKEFHDSADPGLCSRVFASPGLFIKNLREQDVNPLTQEGISSMAYLINMIHQLPLSQSNTQVSAAWMSSDKLSQSNAQISSAEVKSDRLSQSDAQVSSAEVKSDRLSQSDAQISSAEVKSDRLSKSDAQISSAEVKSDRLSQSDAQISSAEVKSDRLSQSNAQTSSAEVSSDTLSQSDAQVSSAEVKSDRLSQSDTQISSAEVSSDIQSNTQVRSWQLSSDKQSPELSCAVHHSPSLQRNAAVIDCEVSRPSDIQISSVSQSCGNKCVSYGTDLMCTEHVYNNHNEFDDFFSSQVTSRNHTCTLDSVSNASVVKVKAERNSLGINSVNLQQSSQSEMCSQFQPSLVIKQEVESASDGINFLEHLSSDPHTGPSNTCVWGDVKERVELKRRHSESDTVSDHCSSYTKKICSNRVVNETIKTLTIKSELKEKSNNSKVHENNDMEVFDLTQSNTDSEVTESQDPLPVPPVRESVVDRNIKSEKISIGYGTECPDVTICNNMLIKSEESRTSDETSECKYFDSGEEARGVENITVGQRKQSAEEEMPVQFSNQQISHEWDEFDEMCHASVPQIFSQCLSQLLSPHSTTQKSPKSRTSSHKSEISQCRSLSLSPHPESVIQGSIPNRSPSCGISSVRKCTKVSKTLDGINFLEHLLSDHHTGPSNTCVQRGVKERVESKRRHSESDSVSDHCSSYTKKICSNRVVNEIIKTLPIKSKLKEKSKNFKVLENDMEVFDLTQSNTDSEVTESQDTLPVPPVRVGVVDRNIRSEKVSLDYGTDCADITICNNLLRKSNESKTSDETIEYKCFDSGGEARGDENIRVGQQKQSAEEEMPVQFSNQQISRESHEWDKFDEMCHASVPQIFSQCLSQLLSSQSTTQKSPKSRTSSHKSGISQCRSKKSLSLSLHPESVIQGSIRNRSPSCGISSVRKRMKVSKSAEDLPSVFPTQKSPTVNEVIENSLLSQLNDSVFWRDENVPTLSMSPKQVVMTDRGNIPKHRTPIQKSSTVSCSDTVTPPADYSAMKTPQLKKELKKFGLKPSLTKRQAKKMLRYIYDQLHPYITVSDSEDDTQMAKTESSPLKKAGADTHVLRSRVRRTDIVGTLRSPVRRSIMTTEVTSHRGNLVRERKSNTTSQSDAGSDFDDLSSLERSSSSEVTVTEELFCEELDVCSQGGICLSQDADLATTVHNFITRDPNLHQKVLLYEPIWVEQLHADLKANNLRFKLHQLMDYLDEQCITFRTAYGQHNRQKKNLMQEAKRQKSTKKKRNVRDRKLTSSSAVNSSNDG